MLDLFFLIEGKVRYYFFRIWLKEVGRGNDVYCGGLIFYICELWCFFIFFEYLDSEFRIFYEGNLVDFWKVKGYRVFLIIRMDRLSFFVNCLDIYGLGIIFFFGINFVFYI